MKLSINLLIFRNAIAVHGEFFKNMALLPHRNSAVSLITSLATFALQGLCFIMLPGTLHYPDNMHGSGLKCDDLKI
jgi:hypothetical protein